MIFFGSITIQKVKNGYRVDYNWHEEDPETKKSHYKDEEYIFVEREDALTKVAETIG